MNTPTPLSGPAFEVLCQFLARLQQGEVSAAEARTLGIQYTRRACRALAYFGFVVCAQKRVTYRGGKPKLETWFVLMDSP